MGIVGTSDLESFGFIISQLLDVGPIVIVVTAGEPLHFDPIRFDLTLERRRQELLSAFTGGRIVLRILRDENPLNDQLFHRSDPDVTERAAQDTDGSAGDVLKATRYIDEEADDAPASRSPARSHSSHKILPQPNRQPGRGGSDAEVEIPGHVSALGVEFDGRPADHDQFDAALAKNSGHQARQFQVLEGRIALTSSPWLGMACQASVQVK